MNYTIFKKESACVQYDWYSLIQPWHGENTGSIIDLLKWKHQGFLTSIKSTCDWTKYLKLENLERTIMYYIKTGVGFFLVFFKCYKICRSLILESI